jgi:hypothetical protein
MGVGGASPAGVRRRPGAGKDERMRVRARARSLFPIGQGKKKNLKPRAHAATQPKPPPSRLPVQAQESRTSPFRGAVGRVARGTQGSTALSWTNKKRGGRAPSRRACEPTQKRERKGGKAHTGRPRPALPHTYMTGMAPASLRGWWCVGGERGSRREAGGGRAGGGGEEHSAVSSSLLASLLSFLSPFFLSRPTSTPKERKNAPRPPVLARPGRLPGDRGVGNLAGAVSQLHRPAPLGWGRLCVGGRRQVRKGG